MLIIDFSWYYFKSFKCSWTLEKKEEEKLFWREEKNMLINSLTFLYLNILCKFAPYIIFEKLCSFQLIKEDENSPNNRRKFVRTWEALQKEQWDYTNTDNGRLKERDIWPNQNAWNQWGLGWRPAQRLAVTVIVKGCVVAC